MNVLWLWEHQLQRPEELQERFVVQEQQLQRLDALLERFMVMGAPVAASRSVNVLWLWGRLLQCPEA